MNGVMVCYEEIDIIIFLDHVVKWSSATLDNDILYANMVH